MKKSAGVYLFSEDTGKLLLLLRSKICPDPFTWAIAAGAVDEGETFEVAAERELREELNYNETIELTPFFQDLDGGRHFESFISFIPKEIEFKIDLTENIEYKWVSKEDFYEIKPKHWGITDCLSDSSSKIILDSFFK
jgi:ADP-ribose pyrophosphatase YjhB (NUDIX family)